MKVREGYHSEQIRNEAFNYVDLGIRQAQVLDVIRRWQPISSERIAGHLHLQLHQVTPRVLELRELGLVVFCGEGVSQKSGRKVSLWGLNPKGRQLSLF